MISPCLTSRTWLNCSSLSPMPYAVQAGRMIRSPQGGADRMHLLVCAVPHRRSPRYLWRRWPRFHPLCQYGTKQGVQDEIGQVPESRHAGDLRRKGPFPQCRELALIYSIKGNKIIAKLQMWKRVNYLIFNILTTGFSRIRTTSFQSIR